MSASRLHIVTGKGGVGKTTYATTLALCLAEQGQRVLLAECYARDRIAHLLQVPATQGNLQHIQPNLWLVDLNPLQAMKEYALLVLKFETLYKAIFENNLAKHFLKLVPSLAELVMLGKIWYHTQQQENAQRRFDAIVFDAPATGHAIAMLQAAKTVQATLPPGPMRENALLIQTMLQDMHHTRVHLVATPEELPITEALLLHETLSRTMSIASVCINQYTEPFSAELASMIHTQDNHSSSQKILLERLTWQTIRQTQAEHEIERLKATGLPLIYMNRNISEPFGYNVLKQLMPTFKTQEAQRVINF